MDSASMNHYEKQLYSVFKTFDVNNEEALDKSAVHDLCDALQLDERGSALVDTLFDKRTGRVTFAQFRNGLLAVLGGERAPGAAAAPPVDLPPSHSDDDSSGREVAPKFVFGSKKYGRRSRPQHASTTTNEQPSPRASSASRADTDDRRARLRPRCRRSASAMESRDGNTDNEDDDDASLPRNFEHDRRIDRDEALALCRALRMDGIDRRLVERIFEDISAPDTTVGEFFDRLNSCLTTTMDERNVDAERVVDGDESGVTSELVLDAWEGAGVRRPRRLLVELGFAAATLSLSDLERTLDDELRGFAEEPERRDDVRANLFVAALALSRLRLGLARRRADVATAERDKLRNDVVEANRRARLLAQEVDENHARIEADLKANVRRAEARYAETARQAAAEAVAERERAAAERIRLEADLACRVDTESRLRSEAAALRERVNELEARTLVAEERVAIVERERTRLATELRVTSERALASPEPCEAAGELAVCLDRLRLENKLLRDRNDELCAEIEQRVRNAEAGGGETTQGGDLSAELHSLLEQDRSEECDSSLVSMEQKLLTHVEVVTKLRDILEGVREEPSGGGACDSCGRFRALRDRVLEFSDALVLASPPPARGVAAADRAAQTDPADDRVDVAPPATGDSDSLRREALDAQRRHDEEKRKLAGLVRDLETSLEQMKVEYDRCEEYWAAKLDEERDAHAEEQRLGDERLAELVGKIGEYERQFAAAAAPAPAPAPAPLPTIDEKRGLEAQINDLEDEFAQYRREKEAELAAAAERAALLSARLAAAPPAPPAPPAPAPPCACAALADRCRRLEAALGAGGAGGAGGGRALRARAARAEAAVRRLHERLAAADLLVKDLYVENCQLAHRRPL